MPDLSELRSSLKNANRVRDILLTIHDQLQDHLHSLSEMGSGQSQEVGVEFVTGSMEFLLTQLETLHQYDDAIHKSLTATLRTGV